MKEFVIKVNGMVCGGCEKRVQNALKTINGVENVIANYQNGTVTVNVNNDVELKVLKDKIEDIGFDVKED